MNRKDFIQRMIIRTAPTMEKMDDAIAYASNAWERMTASGLGEPKKNKSHEGINWYKDKLTDYQREWFDKFWIVFNHKHSRNRAAKAWFQLGELSVAEYKQIIAAAKAESTRVRPKDQSRKMAEGWLNEYRFEDHVVSDRQRDNEESETRKRLIKGELNSLKMMQKQVPELADQHEPRIKQLEKELKTFDDSQYRIGQ